MENIDILFMQKYALVYENSTKTRFKVLIRNKNLLLAS